MKSNGPKARIREFFKTVRNNKDNYPLIEKELQHMLDDDLDLNVQGYKGQTLLHLVVRLDDPKLIELFVNNGVNLEVASEDGVTPLLYSVIKNKKNSLIELIKFKADVNSCAEYETNALHYAVMYNRADMISILADANAVIDMPDEYNQTAFYIAVETGNVACMKELMNYSPNPFVVNSDDVELSEAVKGRREEVQQIYNKYVEEYNA